MIEPVSFEPRVRELEGRRIREPSTSRIMPPALPDVCAFAAAAERRLAELLSAEVSSELVEPVALELHLASLALAQVRAWRVRGQRRDAFLTLRPLDAHHLAAAAFSSTVGRGTSCLSALEWKTIERMVRAVASTCPPLLGDASAFLRESPERVHAEARCYFEMQLIRPVRAAIGIALTDEPRIARSHLTIGTLSSIELEVRAILGCARLTVADLTNLGSGATLLLETSEPIGADLHIGAVRVASGTLGVESGRYAVRVVRTSFGRA